MHLLHVVDGDDVQHARHLLRRAGVDRLDAAVRDRAAEDLGMQHARQPHGVGVFGAAGDLVAAFEPRHRAADLRADLGGAGIQCRGHQCAPLPSQGRAHGAPDIDPHQFALVGDRAAHVGDELGLLRRGVAGVLEQLVVDALAVEHGFRRLEPRRLDGRGAGDDARRLDRAAVAFDARPRRRAPASRRPSRW